EAERLMRMALSAIPNIQFSDTCIVRFNRTCFKGAEGHAHEALSFARALLLRGHAIDHHCALNWMFGMAKHEPSACGLPNPFRSRRTNEHSRAARQKLFTTD
ncbi:MAG: hypothetical protein AAGK93_08815, partial [Pseudomonadota bacterium]